MFAQPSMPDEERSGPFEKQHSDEALLEFIEQGEVVTTKEVADHFDYHLQTARRRLKTLEQDGQLKKKDVGKRFVWWLPHEQ
jgi:predicted ArsR family transcriptional regulator